MSIDRKNSNGKGTNRTDISSDFNSANPTAALNVQRGGKRFAADILAEAGSKQNPSDYGDVDNPRAREATVGRYLDANPSYAKQGGKTYKSKSKQSKYKGGDTDKESYISAQAQVAHSQQQQSEKKKNEVPLKKPTTSSQAKKQGK